MVFRSPRFCCVRHKRLDLAGLRSQFKSLGRNPEVVLDPPATVTCTLAKALSTWLNESVQPQAKASFNSSVTKLHVGSYTCRNRNGGADAPLSEHALANAIDISDFILASGERVAVIDSSPSDNPPLPVPNPDRTSSSTQRVSVRLDDPEKHSSNQSTMTPAPSSAPCSGPVRMKPTRAIFTSI
jgi:hypothetical protein